MSLRRMGALVRRELVHGSWNALVVYVVVIPVVVSLGISLLFGDLFSSRPTLGVVDDGGSRLAELAEASPSLILRRFDDRQALRQAVGRGAVDMGLALPAGFDERLRAGETAELDAYVWGESLLRDRAVLGATVAGLVRQIAGQPTPVEIQITTLGDEASIPWEQRLIPLLVLMGMVLAGLFVPATSLVGEKTRHTLGALAVTPATLGEILGAKAFVGVVLSMAMTAAVLGINGVLAGEAWLLLLVLTLGSVAAGIFGLLLGVVAKDMNSLMAVVKGIGIFLYAPALVALFPSIPEWVGRLFPTFYLLNPVLQVTQNGAGLAQVMPDLVVLLALIAALIGVTGYAARRMRLAEA